jgi:hypothetical protein
MITIAKLFNNGSEMELFIKEYLRQYAPAGYSTDVKIELIQTYEDWKENEVYFKVKITREESCD